MTDSAMGHRRERRTRRFRAAVAAVATALVAGTWSGSAAATTRATELGWLDRVRSVRADGFRGDELRRTWREVAAVAGPEAVVTWDGRRIEIVVPPEDAAALDGRMGAAADEPGVDIVAPPAGPTWVSYQANGGPAQAGKHHNTGTLGWIVEVNGVRKAVTAAHTTFVGRVHTYSGTTTRIGVTDAVLAPDLDAATIRLDVGSTGQVYGLSEPVNRLLPGNQIGPGLPIWFNGKRSGINRPGVVTKLAVGIGGLVWCTNAAAGPGDSGGPVYGRENGQLTAAGVLSGALLGDPNCTMNFKNLEPIVQGTGGTLVK